MKFILNMLPDCQVCGTKLSWKTWRRLKGKNEELTYPFKMPDGSREEFPVEWLCGSCLKRAERRRHGQEAQRYLVVPHGTSEAAPGGVTAESSSKAALWEREMSEIELEGTIRRFLNARVFAVAGASEDPQKFGHRCYAALLRSGRRVYPLNPNTKTVLGSPAYPHVSVVPEPVEALSIVTPPAVTEQVVKDAIAAGVRYLWMQPGAESATAIREARAAGLAVIAGGPCLLVELAR